MKANKSTLLDLYPDYLIADVGQKTATGFSSVLNSQVSHDMITRLLTSGYVSSCRLWIMVKPMCGEIEDENGVLNIDDSIEAKTYTDCNELIFWHFDHTLNRSAKWVNFGTAIYDNRKMSLPIGVCYLKKDVSHVDKTGKTKRKSSISKQEHFRVIYQRRWNIEEYHKSIKSNTAFPKSPTRKEMTKQSHFTASIMAYVKLDRLKIRCSKNHFALKSIMLVNATKAAWATMQNFSEPKAA